MPEKLTCKYASITWVYSFDNAHSVFYVCDLSHYCIKVFEDLNKLGLIESLDLFELLINDQRLKHIKNWIVILNKTDVFREHLYHQPLSLCFGDEYKGRNYNDMHPIKTRYFKRVIKELLLNDIEMDINNISEDVVGIMSIYYDGIRCESLLHLVYKDGVEFIRQKFLKLKPDSSEFTLKVFF